MKPIPAIMPSWAGRSINGNRSTKRAPARVASSRRMPLKRRMRSAISVGWPNAAATGERDQSG
jgi:hypothetical protein